MQGGVSADIESLESQGQGEIHFNLENLVPNTASIDLKTASTMTINQGGSAQAMTMKMDTAMKMEQL